MASGLASGDTASAASGAQAGRSAVENNSLSIIVKAGEKAFEACVKNATCRGVMHQMGIAAGLTNSQYTGKPGPDGEHCHHADDAGSVWHE
ncbi:VENN motif pre-toxin domain-containing protein [Candidatus Symbiopectobacterium sp. NZEC151]|uniref:VENN motif pre-toxin domain-containing protein n=1 Tax=unclassified Symbiopectobacterium TaxID=2794573 RepID=UPI0034DB4870|nr:VENN motif pre-toxin domain-containing protein [Candidatus Symbiopectobacterium sp. NZEC151]